MPALRVLSDARKQIITAQSESSLLETIRRILFKQRGYCLAAVHFVQHDAASGIGRPIPDRNMTSKLRALVLEDNPADAGLIVRALETAGCSAKATRIEGEADFGAALDSAPDMILADYSLPRFSAVHALEMLKLRSDGRRLLPAGPKKKSRGLSPAQWPVPGVRRRAS